MWVSGDKWVEVYSEECDEVQEWILWNTEMNVEKKNYEGTEERDECGQVWRSKYERIRE